MPSILEIEETIKTAREYAAAGKGDYFDALQASRTAPGVYSSLSWALNVAMALDDAACERYAAIYGRAWEPVPPICGDAETLEAEFERAFVRAVGTEARTVVGHRRG